MAMRHKQAFGLGFPLAILLVIGVIAWLTAGGGGSEVEATITPQTVCDSLVETDYDGSGIITLETAEGVRTARFEFNVSPPDSRPPHPGILRYHRQDLRWTKRIHT